MTRIFTVHSAFSPTDAALTDPTEDALSQTRRLEPLLFDTRPLTATWQPLHLHSVPGPQGGLTVPDVVRAVLPGLAFSRAAVGVLEPLLLQHGELLPVTLNGADGAYFLYHALRHPRLTDPARNDDPGFHFRPDRIEGHHFFQLRRYVTFFVSDHFTDTFHAAGLTGLRFREVWPDPQTGPLRA